MDKKTVKLTADANVVRFLSTGGQLAQQLPTWKRGVLEASSLATNSEPRTPVVTQDESTAKSENQ